MSNFGFVKNSLLKTINIGFQDLKSARETSQMASLNFQWSGGEPAPAGRGAEFENLNAQECGGPCRARRGVIGFDVQRIHIAKLDLEI